MAKTVKDYKEWIDTYECQTEDEQELVDGFKNILDEIFANHKKELDEKDKEFGLLLADRDKLEMYRQNQLKKSDFEELYKCSSCLMLSEVGGFCSMCDNDNELIIYKNCLKNNSKYESLED